MTWIASTHSGRREQLGPFILGTGNIGGVAMSTGPGIGLSEDEGLALLDRAVAEGFTAFDTADAYTGGTSERVIGQWNRTHPDSSTLTQTKTGVTANGPDLDPERIRRQLANSTKTLGHVDLYLAHTTDPSTPWERSLPVFSDAVDDGRIRAYGLSNVNAIQLADALATADRLGLHRPEIVQNSYSLLDRSDDRDVLPLVTAEGLAYTPFSPLANGILAGRYSDGQRPQTGSRASTAPHAERRLGDAELMDTVRRFDTLAADHGISPAGLALAWLLNHAAVTAPIVAFSKEHHWRSIDESRAFDWDTNLDDALDTLFAIS